MTSKVVYNGNLRTECTHIKSGNSLTTDAPVDNSGKGEFFSPTDLVATALASCMITVMGIKAKNSNIPFDKISADVEKIMESSPRRISQINVHFLIGNKWDTKQQKIMEATVRTCPVTKSLHSDLVQNIVFVYS